ncbi:ALF repeat-containing protein [Streptomyces noursei]|uniref:ALF repeat-containing protein n=1 Tax=Streptomyces noursei TaxID=1971 RepID=UPI00332D0FD3
MKLARISTVVAAAAMAPAVLFSSPAVAADRGAVPADSAPDVPAGNAEPEQSGGDGAGAGKEAAERDRIEIFRMLADKNIGKGLHREAQRALDGGAEAMRRFLEVGQYAARDEDNRFAILRILGDEKAGRSVRGAAERAMDGTPEDRVRFLESGRHLAQQADDRVRTMQILSIGGPAVQEAAEKALRGTYDDVRRFLEVGQYEARAEDEAAEAKRKAEEEAAKKRDEKPTPQTGTGTTGGAHEGGTAPAAKPSKPATGSPRPVTATALDAGPAARSGDGELAATGAGSTLPWTVGGSAVALTAGAGLVVAARRRATGGH